MKAAEKKQVVAKYQKKEAHIKMAIERVKATLRKYSEFTEAIYSKCKAEGDRSWSDEDRAASQAACPNWNDYHDLQDRLQHRLVDNYCDYQAWSFEHNGYAVY